MLAAVPSASAATDGTGGGEGRVDHRTYRTSTGENDYLVYVPKGWKESDRLPLYVNLHGCGTTAQEMIDASLVNAVADRERFLVAYPDNDGQCWRAVFHHPPSTTRGGGGDADIIAGITRETMSTYHADSNRVYLIGGSSGGFQASAMGATYPDLYAAIGVIAGGGYGTDFQTCQSLTDQNAPAYAPSAVAEMGRRAHVMPFFTIGGTNDVLGEQPAPGGCTRRAYLEWLATDNLLKPGQDGDTFRDDPASTVTGQEPGGYTWTKKVARDPKGCQIAERWIVDGMGHNWPGDAGDPKGPSTAEASWSFFKQFTLRGGNSTCHG
ncbi:extracellular catalytic domain type 1 short-chain-length polyhydroxyalkanoate depolymerase [Streptomyces melanosporofaciens]|uniref:extracellular catalytic domain type 1 short-chain-length polyhydroxyalkanoate depolymerase n=1 Tax=Streptomyces melanosporofaciens TaxID=67327 RepID=UPI001430790C|nr:PHB depolymerase family esterase [Streptomyces melanosporofaciens]